MKANVLRKPLITSAIVLVIFSLLFYFTSTSPGGSVWTSIGTLFVVAFTTVQWMFAMAIGLAVSLIVLIGIFLGAVAMFNPASSSRMYEGLRQTLRVWFSPVINLFKSDRQEKLTAALDAFGRDLKKEISAEIQVAQAKVQKTQAELTAKTGTLTSRLATLEETAAGLAGGEQVDALALEIKEAVESAAELKGTVDSLETRVEQTAKQVQEPPEPPPAVDITPLQQDIAEVQAQLASVQQKVDEASKAAAQAIVETTTQPAKSAPVEKASQKTKKDGSQDKEKAEENEEHRIFSYFKDPADKKKVADLVAGTLKKDMSYKQVMDFVAKEIGGKKGAIITSHPSLSKDYIRLCRKQS